MTELKQYRKKPVVIEAVQFDGKCASNVLDFCQGNAFVTLPPSGNYLYIKTLEGDMKVSPNDFIIRGVKGELYPCKPDIFAETYEPADTPPTPALSLAKDALELIANAPAFKEDKSMPCEYSLGRNDGRDDFRNVAINTLAAIKQQLEG